MDENQATGTGATILGGAAGDEAAKASAAAQENAAANEKGAEAPAGTDDAGRQASPDDGGKADESGVPEQYDFRDAVPDGMEYDEAGAKAFSEVAKECGLTQEQASKLASYGMEYMKNGVGAYQAAQAAQRNKWADDARTELAGDFNSTVAKCGAAINTLSQKIPGLREAFNETGAGNRIEMIRMMSAVSDLIEEDRGHGANGGAARDRPIYGNTDFNIY